jgi:hypothetical protein
MPRMSITERLKREDRLDAVANTVEVVEGRDELNLAEFPLAALADRVPSDQKTLMFADTIWDKQVRKPVERRLTISASDRYGLPTALDDEVILGLIQLSRQTRFADRHVTFSRYELINILGWRQEGKSYRRLDESLRRWLGVTLYYDKAWWDKQAGCWIDAAFHLIDQIILPRRRSNARGLVGESAPSSFTWNEIVFASFQAGYLKQLDMELYRRLNSTVAKRMLRFLDKRFYHRSQWEFPLVEFACEHIGLSRNYDTGQLKRRMIPAIVELEEVGFIGQMPHEARFVRLSRGQWQVKFAKAKRRPQPTVKNSPPLAIVEQLVARGIHPRVAKRLAATFPVEVIETHVAAFDQLRADHDGRVARNPAGYLVQSIRRGYQVSRIESRSTRPPNIPQRQVPTTRGATPRTDAVTTKTELADCARVAEFLAGLTPAQRSELELAALHSAPTLLRDGLQRAAAGDNPAARNTYLAAILRQHVLKRLDEPVE